MYERRIRSLVCVPVCLCKMFARDERMYLDVRYVEMQNNFFPSEGQLTEHSQYELCGVEKSYNKRNTEQQQREATATNTLKTQQQQQLPYEQLYIAEKP